MGFKIKNITNELNKRHNSFNTSIMVDTGSGQRNLSPGQELIIDSNIIPITVRTLQMEGKISLNHISNNEIKQLIELIPSSPPQVKSQPNKPIEAKPVEIKKQEETAVIETPVVKKTRKKRE